MCITFCNKCALLYVIDVEVTTQKLTHNQISFSQVKVTADNVVKSYNFGTTVEFSGHIVVGYGSRRYDGKECCISCALHFILSN